MNAGDKALERVIAEITSALAMTGDPRLVKLHSEALKLMTGPSEIERLQRERERAVRWRNGRR